MSKYVIAFIDEEQDPRDIFENYFEQFDDQFHVELIIPSGKTVTAIVDELVEISPDIVVIDYYLKYSDDTVPENGDVVMQRINDRKPLMPVILFTSFPDHASKSRISPDKKRNIHNKMEIANPKDLKFKDTVLEYVDYYKRLIKGYKEEFAELSLKTVLSDDERGRLNELDNILESAADQQNAVNQKNKSEEQFDQLIMLIDSTKELLSDIKKRKDD